MGHCDTRGEGDEATGPQELRPRHFARPLAQRGTSIIQHDTICIHTYIHTYIYIYGFLYIYIDLSIYLSIYIYEHIYIYTYMYTYIAQCQHCYDI